MGALKMETADEIFISNKEEVLKCLQNDLAKYLYLVSVHIKYGHEILQANFKTDTNSIILESNEIRIEDSIELTLIINDETEVSFTCTSEEYTYMFKNNDMVVYIDFLKRIVNQHTIEMIG